jgi:hypothetical protein
VKEMGKNELHIVLEISRDDVIAAFLVLGISVNPTERQVRKIAELFGKYIIEELLKNETNVYLKAIRTVSDEVLLLDDKGE